MQLVRYKQYVAFSEDSHAFKTRLSEDSHILKLRLSDDSHIFKTRLSYYNHVLKHDCHLQYAYYHYECYTAFGNISNSITFGNMLPNVILHLVTSVTKCL